MHVARRPAHGLDERPGRPQEPLLVGVQDGHQRHFRQVQPLAQQVDADQDVEGPAPQVAQDFDALERLDVGVEVAHLDPELLVVGRQVLGHPLGQRGDEHPLALAGAVANLREQVVDLPLDRTDVDRRIHQAGRPDDLLDDGAAGLLQLVRSGRRGDEHHLPGPLLPLLEVQRPVVERRRQAEAVGDQDLLARAVAVIHAADLRHGLMALVDDRQRVGRQIVEQRRRRRAGRTPGQMPRVVLDAVAVPDLLDHLEVEHRPLVEPMRFQHLAFGLELASGTTPAPL